MGFSKFIVSTLLLATTLVVLVKSQGDCPFNCTSYKGPQKIFNVILKDGISTESHFNLLTNCCNKSVKHISNADFSKDFEESDIRDFSVGDAIRGYSAHFDPAFVGDHLRNSPEVELAEEDTKVSIRYPLQNRAKKILTTIRKNPVFNMDRIDQAKFPLDKKYEYPATAGKGVNIYIVDTGILITHNEVKGRARFGGSFCEGCSNTDEDGHGTHVAAIAAGNTFGVANLANLIAVRVLDSQGFGTTAGVIAGLAFVLSEHIANLGQSSVINMSLGGGLDKSLNKMVQVLTDNGVHVSVAAGNEFTDACTKSPASAPSAITVGATNDIDDSIPDFSNTGKCVDIFAPGVNVKSAYIGSDNATEVLSGTSMSTPHITGTVALIIGEFKDSPPAKMVQTLVNFATKGVIPGDLKGSPNVFLRVPYNTQ